jgi:hypothetical protein
LPEQKIMKDINLNEPITVTVPAHIWLALTAAYNDCDWINDNLGYVLEKAMRQIMDPIYVKEQEAAQQEAMDKKQQFFENLSSHLPGMPGSEGPDDDKLE